MSYGMEYYPGAVAQAPAEVRAAFIRRTYAHLAGAVLAFVGLEYLILSIPGIDDFIMSIFGQGGIAIFVIFALFIGVSYLATSWAQSSTSIGMQYAGLSLYVAAQAFIFLPMLWYANNFAPGAIQSAGIMTLLVFGGLTLGVFMTGRDYSFLGPVLGVVSMLVLGFIVVAMFFAPSFLGLVFSFFMVGLASLYIIYDTSNVIHRYNESQHVAAALALFASVALLFYYILRIVLASGNRN